MSSSDFPHGQKPIPDFKSLATQDSDRRPVIYLAQNKDSLFLQEKDIHKGLQWGKVYWQATAIVAGKEFTGNCLGMAPPDNYGVCFADFLIPMGARFFKSMIGLAQQDSQPGQFGSC